MTGPQAQQWRVTELTFTARGEYARPAADVALSAAFTGPKGERFDVPGFWDGDQTWKIRFAPTAPGTWSYTTTANVAGDAGLHGRSGRLDVSPAGGDNPLFSHGGQLKVSANRRYLTYSDGTPFFWLGDTWWFAPSSLVPFDGSSNPEYPSMYKALIDTRRAQGFSVAHMAFLGPMAQSSGVNSFTLLGLQRRIDVAYWRQVDRYIDYANQAGIVPVIGLAFHSGVDQLSLEDWKFLWRAVIARYGAHAVTWLICGEYNADLGDVAGRVPMVLALGQYIKDTDPYQRAMTVHPWWFGGDKRQAWDQPWYDFIMLQGAHLTYPDASLYLDAYRRPEAKPVLEGECNYEGIKGMTDYDVRWCAYRAIQSGSFGYTYGAHGLWYPTQSISDTTFKEWGDPIPWWVALAAPGGAQMRILRDVYESVDWWKLEPRPEAFKRPLDWPEMMSVAVKADGDDTLVAYIPRGVIKTRAVKLQGLPAGARYGGQWVNPRTGERTDLEEPLAVEEGQVELPDRRSGDDWVMVLRRVVAQR